MHHVRLVTIGQGIEPTHPGGAHLRYAGCPMNESIRILTLDVVGPDLVERLVRSLVVLTLGPLLHLLCVGDSPHIGHECFGNATR